MKPEIISIIIAAVAALFTGGSLLYTALLHKSQKNYIMNQDKLNKIRISNEDDNKKPNIIIELDTQFIEYGLYNSYLILTNIGGSDAININIQFDEDNKWPYEDSGLPYEVLKPGQKFVIDVYPNEKPSKVHCLATWHDKNNELFEDHVVLQFSRDYLERILLKKH